MRVYPAVKFAGEWLAALVLLVMGAPLMAVMMALVKCTSRGPVVYRQVRLGRGGRTYWIYKIRTMAHDCEARTGPVWATEDDPRVTRLGKILRGTHLDELPQLVNVLRGEMALIGPRPERPEIAAEIERKLPGFGRRLAVRPGITGLAQLVLGPDRDIDGVRYKLEFDLHYIARLSAATDLRLAAATVCHFAAAGLTAVTRALTGGRHLPMMRVVGVPIKIEPHGAMGREKLPVAA